MSYTTLESNMEHFLLDGEGYIAYLTYKHWLWCRKPRQIVLADPICDEENYQNLLTEFLKQHPNAVFIGLSKKPAIVLEKMGYKVNQFGIETDILLNEFDLRGKKRAKLRQWRNKCERENVVVKEIPIEDHPDIEKVKDLSKRWLKNKKKGKIQFLVRPLRFKQEKDVRYFFAYQNDDLIAFAVFDPIYKNEKIIGYFHNMDRYESNVPHGTSPYIIISAIEKFKEEGISHIALGMSPMSLQRGMKNELKSYDLFTRKAFWYAYEKLNFLYPFQGNAIHKNKFNGIQEPIYISSTNGMNLKEIFIMVKAMGIL